MSATAAVALPAAAQPFVDFTRRLHRQGFPTTTEQTIAFLKSIELMGPKGIGDVYWAARATLGPTPERIGEFDAVFDAMFRGATGSIPAADPAADEETVASEANAAGLEPLTVDRAADSGAAATAHEALSPRRLAARSPGDRLNAMQRELHRLAPRRKGHRYAAVDSGQRIDLGRSLSRMVRGGAGVATFAWKKRQERLRRVLVLVDISGSMKAHTEDYLRFVHALTQALPAVETFCFGTRLTRLTRALRHKELARSLAEIAPAVADWDGGTRIAESLGAFLGVPRFSRASRGALVIVLSDGLERGDAAPMVAAVRRLAARSWRLAWLTPLAGDPAFSPQTDALKAILPIVDYLGDGSGVGPLCDFLERSAGLGGKLPAAGRSSATIGSATHADARHRRTSSHLAEAGPAVAGGTDAAANIWPL